LVHVAMSEYYNRKKKKYLERENRKDKWEEALIAVLREVLPGQSPNLRTYFQCGQAGHFRREPPPVPCPICRGNHWKAHCPQFPGDTRPEPPTQWQVPGPPIQAPVTTLKAEEHWEILTIEKHKASLLTDTGASISAIPFSPGPRSSKKKITVWSISGQPLERYFTQPLACSWGDFHLCHSVIIIPKIPTPLLGWDLLSKLEVQLLYPQGSTFACPDRRTSRPHSVDGWTHCGTGTNSGPSLNSFQGPLLVSPSKTISFKTWS
jgi:hypothetical protein